MQNQEFTTKLLLNRINLFNSLITNVELDTKLEYHEIKLLKSYFKRHIKYIEQKLSNYGCKKCNYAGFHVYGGIKYPCGSVIDLTRNDVDPMILQVDMHLDEIENNVIDRINFINSVNILFNLNN